MIKQLLEKVSWYRNPIKYARNHGMKIGEKCSISSHSDIGTEPYLVELGNHVEITSDCHLITHDGAIWVLPILRGGVFSLDQVHKYGKITIGDNSYIGIGSIILPGVTIGKNCIIGAGSVVTKNIPDNSVACGVPAKVIKTVDAILLFT